MADYSVRAGTGWRETFWLGRRTDRWRADDFDIYLQIKLPGSDGADAALIEASTIDGRITVTDPVSRRLEVNIEWTEIEDLAAQKFEFDFLLINKSTEARDRSVMHTLTVLRGITQKDI